MGIHSPESLASQRNPRFLEASATLPAMSADWLPSCGISAPSIISRNSGPGFVCGEGSHLPLLPRSGLLGGSVCLCQLLLLPRSPAQVGAKEESEELDKDKGLGL